MRLVIAMMKHRQANKILILLGDQNILLTVSCEGTKTRGNLPSRSSVNEIETAGKQTPLGIVFRVGCWKAVLDSQAMRLTGRNRQHGRARFSHRRTRRAPARPALSPRMSSPLSRD